MKHSLGIHDLEQYMLTGFRRMGGSQNCEPGGSQNFEPGEVGFGAQPVCVCGSKFSPVTLTGKRQKNLKGEQKNSSSRRRQALTLYIFGGHFLKKILLLPSAAVFLAGGQFFWLGGGNRGPGTGGGILAQTVGGVTYRLLQGVNMYV